MPARAVLDEQPAVACSCPARESRWSRSAVATWRRCRRASRRSGHLHPRPLRGRPRRDAPVGVAKQPLRRHGRRARRQGDAPGPGCCAASPVRRAGLRWCHLRSGGSIPAPPATSILARFATASCWPPGIAGIGAVVNGEGIARSDIVREVARSPIRGDHRPASPWAIRTTPFRPMPVHSERTPTHAFVRYVATPRLSCKSAASRTGDSCTGGTRLVDTLLIAYCL